MRLFFLSTLLLVSCLVHSQDIIHKRNGFELEVKVLEIGINKIKYKQFNDLEGPDRLIKIRNVYLIEYENGKTEKFALYNTTIDSLGYYKANYTSYSVGYGNSYGGLGIQAQWRKGDSSGFGYHFGVGKDIENNTFGFSLGARYYPSRDLYINLQGGSLGTQEEKSYYYNSFSDSLEDENIYGLSLMLGGSWFLDNEDRFGVNAGIGVSYIYKSLRDDTKLAYDIGLSYKF